MRPKLTLTALLLSVATLLPACSLIPGGDIWSAGVVSKGQDAADDFLQASEYGTCQAATIRSIRERYGQSSERAKAYRDFCESGPAPVFGPVEE